MQLRFLIFALLSLVYVSVSGQTTVVLDNLPPTVKYKQIKTPNFKIIYPSTFSEQGQRMANTMEHLYAPISASLSKKNPKRISIILQNQQTVSNGFVTIGPRRSEFYTMSPQFTNFLGNNDWLNLLAVHEYRHVVQYNRSRTGLTGLAYYVFGEATQNGIATTTVPSWFWEGDAVNIETSLTHSGRGRLPYFTREFRANLLEKGSFNYSKQYLRSFKDYIPNHYVLGYHFATYLKTKYGHENMEKMVAQTWNNPIIPFRYSFSVKKYGGAKLPESYQTMMSELKQKWSNELSKEQFTEFNKVNSSHKSVYTNYNYPQLIDNENIVVLKSGLGDFGHFVLINRKTGSETKIFTPGLVNDAGALSVQGSTIVWNEFEFDSRWRARSYSVIKSYNIATKRLTQISSKSRYASASLSPDREMIVTVDQAEDYSNHLVILNAYSGQKIRAFENEDNSFFAIPVWDNTSKFIEVMKVKDDKKSVVEIDVSSGKEHILIPASHELISYVAKFNEWLYYVSAFSGIDNIYALNTKTEKRYRVTSAKYGAYNPVVSKNGETMYYNNFTVLGNDVVAIDLDPNSFLPLEDVENRDINWGASVIAAENNVDILSTVPDSTYKESKYHKKPFNIHSWGPLYQGNIDEIEIGVFSRNVLSTTDLFLGYNFNNQGENNFIARFSYQGLYPIIDLIGTYGHRSTTVNFVDTLDVARIDKLEWNELTVKGGLRIPFLLTHNKYHTSLEILNYVGVTHVSDYSSTRLGDGRYFSLLNNGNLVQNEFDITFISVHKQSKRDIRSKYGTILEFEQFGTPYGGDFNGSLSAFKSQFYFPGLVKHHSLNFFIGYQHNQITLDDDNYWFQNRMPYPRGVSARLFEDLWTIRTNYELPLLYPDMKIGPWVYIQRIKANLFFDYGHGNTDVVNREVNLQFQDSLDMYSLGLDISFDFNFMRALPLLELGVRYSYLPDLGTSTFELLVSQLGF